MMGKSEKRGPGTTNGAAGSESKQNKGIREGFFGPRIQLLVPFRLLGPETQKVVKSRKIIKMHKFTHFQFSG